MKKILKKIVFTLLPELKKIVEERDFLKKERDFYLKFVPPGHFYSPIPSEEDIKKIEINEPLPDAIRGIDLNSEKQLKLLDTFHKYYIEQPFTDNKSTNLRYYFLNSSYSYSDAIILYCMIRHLTPKKIVEVGCGYSSCVILDTNELFFENKIECTFIEPYPDLLKSLIKPEDNTRIKIIEKKLQDIPLDFFKQLNANDILFIDSTHVSKFKSDVNYLIHDILPTINKGVHIHIHDIFYPFEYPKEWLYEGRAQNEQYILRAFLEFNHEFEIVLFNTYLETMFKDRIFNKFPLLFKNMGGSIWIKRK